MQIGGSGRATRVTVAPAAKRGRFAFWDFSGKTNEQAATRLRQGAEAIRRELAALDFRPQSVRDLDLAGLQRQVTTLLTQAGEDAAPYRSKVDALLKRAADLRAGSDRGDWSADPDLAAVLTDLDTLLWKVKIQALLNSQVGRAP